MAVILGTSYATALRGMEHISGCVDLGVNEQRYRRARRMLRISCKRLQICLDGRQV